eukprot:365492-Chlamydomonas_euryale.AAC.4
MRAACTKKKGSELRVVPGPGSRQSSNASTVGVSRGFAELCCLGMQTTEGRCMHTCIRVRAPWYTRAHICGCVTAPSRPCHTSMRATQPCGHVHTSMRACSMHTFTAALMTHPGTHPCNHVHMRPCAPATIHPCVC